MEIGVLSRENIKTAVCLRLFVENKKTTGLLLLRGSEKETADGSERCQCDVFAAIRCSECFE